MVQTTHNPVSQLTDYELRYLVTHLDAAGQWDDVHRVLALETEDGQNAWHEAKRTSADEADFLRDISIAKRCLDPDRVVLAVETRYALVGATLRSRGGNAPPALIDALVRSEVWTVAQGVEQARRLTDPADRARALMLVSQSGGVVLLDDAAELLPSISDLGVRDNLTRGIAERYADLGLPRRAIDVLAQTLDRQQLQQALADLLAAHPIALLPEADRCLGRLTSAQRLETICGAMVRARDDRSALVERATHEWEAMRAEPKGDPTDALWARVVAGAPLLKYLSGDRLAVFMADVHQGLASFGAQLYLLQRVAPWLPQLADSRALKSVFDADYLIEDQRAEAVALLADVLPPDGRDEAVRWLAGRSVRRSSLGKLLRSRITLEPTRGDDLIEQGLRDIEALDGWERSQALTALAPRLSGRYVARAIALAAEIESGDHRFNALHALASCAVELDNARALLDQARRFHGHTAAGSSSEGFDRRAQLTAAAFATIPKEEWPTEIASFLPDLHSKPAVYLNWAGLVSLLPFVDDMEDADTLATALCVQLLEHYFSEEYRIESYVTRLPPRLYDPALDCVLNYPQAGPRNRVLAAFAPRLSATHLTRIAEHLNAIRDAPAIKASLAAMRELAEATAGCNGDRLSAILLTTAARRVGIWVEDAAQWVHALVTERLAEMGDVDRALDASELIEAHTWLYRRALARVASRMPPDRIRHEVERRLSGTGRKAHNAASGQVESVTESSRKRPENIEALVRHADADYRKEIRDRTLPRDANRYVQVMHFACFVPAVDDDRSRRVDDFFRTVTRGSSHEVETLEALIPFVDPSRFERCAEIIESAAQGDTQAARTAFALAARDPGRFRWAMRRYNDLEKWDRVRCAVAHAHSFSGDERAALSREVAKAARMHVRDGGSGLELCMAAIVPEDEADRVALLCEALEAAAMKPHVDTVRQNHQIIGAYLLLVVEGARLTALRVALERGFTTYREHLLSALEGLGPVVGSLTNAEDLRAVSRAIDDVGRWWR